MTARHRWARLPAVTFAAIVVMLTAALAAPVQAKAQTPAPPGNIVTFGDSYTASPDQWLNGIAASSVPSSSASEEYPQTGGCLQSPYNWPRQLAAQTGLEVADWSCTADTTAGMLDRIDRAIGAGDISPDTQAVIFAIGGNDFGPAGVLYELTEGHDTCSPDDALRYVSGILDVTSPAYEMIMHPTGLGHSAIAANNAAALGLPSEEPEALDDLTSADLSSALSSLSSGSSESPTPIG